MKQTIFIFFIYVFCTVAKAADNQTDTAYISDELTVFVHTGPTRNYRIVDTVIAGSPIKLLQRSEDGSFSQIEYGNEKKTGWIESRYISTDESLQQAFERTREALEEKTSVLAQTESLLEGERSEKASLQTQLSRYTQDSKTLQAKLNAAETELNKLKQADAESQEKIKMDWLIKGGILAVTSLLIGYILALMPRRKKRTPDLF
ncbi:TIGR04211 family SH3 domain-containing protein [Gayadomonas joobiniege]|uniref:TIGR04211 family SH3 domain-containing protein n=1 Tax=Gayadomonas joobiniege TaxID=1234606 RepID=UPI0003769BC2|nr:TIGR04211 family SH3 domain-containing protein [Gayadomonas joobiniege]